MSGAILARCASLWMHRPAPRSPNDGNSGRVTHRPCETARDWRHRRESPPATKPSRVMSLRQSTGEVRPNEGESCGARRDAAAPTATGGQKAPASASRPPIRPKTGTFKAGWAFIRRIPAKTDHGGCDAFPPPRNALVRIGVGAVALRRRRGFESAKRGPIQVSLGQSRRAG